MHRLNTTLAALANYWHLAIRGVDRAAHTLDAHADPALVAALVVGAVAFLGIALINLRRAPSATLKAALRPYEIHEQERQPADGAERRTDSQSGRVLARLAVPTASREILEKLNDRLGQAGISVPAAEFLMLWAGAAVVLAGLAAAAAGVTGGIIAAILVALVPLAAIDVMIDRRRRQFASQIPNVLELLAASTRAGFSLLQSLSSIVDQVPEPMASELRLAFAATRFGTPVEDALELVAGRTYNRDFSWAVTAIRIQRTVGGNLAEILDTVAATMTERDRLRREIRTLTAEGRISAIIVGLLPFTLAGFIFTTNRSYLASLLHSAGGELAIAGGLLLELAGVWWLYRIVHIES